MCICLILHESSVISSTIEVAPSCRQPHEHEQAAPLTQSAAIGTISQQTSHQELPLDQNVVANVSVADSRDQSSLYSAS
jgi:hypothetical protein